MDDGRVAGAVQRVEGSIKVTPPSELDNADPFVLDTMTVRVPTKIIGRTVEYNKADLPEEACAGMAKVQAIAAALNGRLINGLITEADVLVYNNSASCIEALTQGCPALFVHRNIGLDYDS